MSLLVDPPAQPQPPGPEQGVIEDARSRQHLRRRRIALMLLAVVGIGAITVGLIGGQGSGPASRARPSGARIGAIQRRRSRAPDVVNLSPTLEGGQYGWCVTTEGGGSCPIIPTAGSPFPGAIVDSEPTAHKEVVTLLLTPEAVGVLVNGRRVPAVTVPAHLPYRLRVVRVTLPVPDAAGGSSEELPSPATSLSLVAINAQGKVLRQVDTPTSAAPGDIIRWWKRPSATPQGPCQIHAQGISGLTPRWGHVASVIRPYPGKIAGRAFYSCINTEYYLHNWPLDAAILLDAEHPGRPPAAIPGLRPVAGAPNILNGIGDGFHGEQTATRTGNAWLVVAGGSGLTQRIEVLRHLNASVSL